MISIRRTNTILYCARWAETVAFYRNVLQLPATFESEWFVEFQLAASSYLSVADHRRATIAPNHGAGLTLSWEVDDVESLRSELIGSGLQLGPIGARWGAATLDLFDPEGNRIELWSGVTGSGSRS
jgi:catechol 2,3-dioxygenase-like lactoylglutathione lyase family enzyme